MVDVAQLVELRIVVPAVVGSNPIIHPLFASVAQLDRATDFGSVGWGFESLRARLYTPWTCFARYLWC